MKHIVIIDDSAIVLKAVERSLELAGFIVTAISDAGSV